MENLHTVDKMTIPFDAIVCDCNCFVDQGGFTKKIHEMYPEAHYADDLFVMEQGWDRLGNCSFANVTIDGRKVIIGNLYGQVYYGERDSHYVKYFSLREAFRMFVGKVKCLGQLHDNFVVVCPWNMGLDTDCESVMHIEAMMEKVAKAYPNIEFYMVKTI